MKKTLTIEGMSCGHCEKRVKDALEQTEGITRVDVDLANGQAVIEENGSLSKEQLQEIIDDAGYQLTKVQ